MLGKKYDLLLCFIDTIRHAQQLGGSSKLARSACYNLYAVV